jgi:hypothetical protein
MKRALLTIKKFVPRMFAGLPSPGIQTLDINFWSKTMSKQDEEAFKEKLLLNIERGTQFPTDEYPVCLSDRQELIAKGTSSYVPFSDKPYGPMTKTPKNRPGRVIPLRKKCAMCGSKQLAYDFLNVVTCESCDSILSVSKWWHPYWGGQIQSPRPRRRIG